MRAFVALSVVLCLFLAGCSTGRRQAGALADRDEMVASVMRAGHFDLYSLSPAKYVPGAPLTVYIEGDGYAYVTRNRLSPDPTPRDSVVLKMMAREAGHNAVYLARPCQFVDGANRRNCHPAYWSLARYSEDVVAATNEAIDHLMAISGAQGLRLVGHSGGGVVALLVAARRSDVSQVVTLAAPLDTDTWTRLDGAAPLVYSLNPADMTDRLVSVPQIHFVGGKDKVVPLSVAQSYAARFPAGHKPAIRVMPEEAHDCCWAERWPTMNLQGR